MVSERVTHHLFDLMVNATIELRALSLIRLLLLCTIGLSLFQVVFEGLGGLVLFSNDSIE